MFVCDLYAIFLYWQAHRNIPLLKHQRKVLNFETWGVISEQGTLL